MYCGCSLPRMGHHSRMRETTMANDKLTRMNHQQMRQVVVELGLWAD